MVDLTRLVDEQAARHASLLPYQTRAVAELAELDAKREALRGWMRNEAFGAFDERLDQKLQLHYMDAYAACLGRRISRFMP